MILIDSHTHLFLPEFDNDRSETVKRAVDAGIKYMLVPNIDSQSVAPMLDLCRLHPDCCFPMIGLHPTSVKENWKDEIDSLYKHLSESKFIAIGEVGLDLYWDKTFFAQQCQVLELQIEWARRFKLPLVIHTRDAFSEIIELMDRNYNGTPYRGVFHSFTGSVAQAQKVISLGFKIGLNGVVSFKNSNLSDVVDAIPLDEILLETDSPYLTPMPKRGQRNESAYLVYVAQKIADIKGVTVDAVAEITTRNALQLFDIV